jgi:hypothetical protein
MPTKKGEEADERGKGIIYSREAVMSKQKGKRKRRWRREKEASFDWR